MHSQIPAFTRPPPLSQALPSSLGYPQARDRPHLCRAYLLGEKPTHRGDCFRAVKTIQQGDSVRDSRLEVLCWQGALERLTRRLR